MIVSNMKRGSSDVFQDILEDGDDTLSMKSARDGDGEFLSMSRLTVYHSAQELDNPRQALFDAANNDRVLVKVGYLLTR